MVYMAVFQDFPEYGVFYRRHSAQTSDEKGAGVGPGPISQELGSNERVLSQFPCCPTDLEQLGVLAEHKDPAQERVWQCQQCWSEN
jgi:hypothetical protein